MVYDHMWCHLQIQCLKQQYCLLDVDVINEEELLQLGRMEVGFQVERLEDLVWVCEAIELSAI